MRDVLVARTRAKPYWPGLLVALSLAVIGCKQPEVCDDGVDNDGDGQADCADTECSAAPNCAINVCGNGAVDGAEECDGANLNNLDCTDQGFDAGALACNDDCTLNTDACEDLACGNGVIDANEECDGGNLNNQDCTDAGFDAGTLACNVDCTFDTGGCVLLNDCGNGVVDANEQCDGNNLNGQECSDLGLGFEVGVLLCNADCTFNTGACINLDCGNGVIDQGEECDGANLNNQQCTDVGFDAGTLACNADCSFNTGACIENCGNGAIDAGEECDGANLNNQDCTDQGFASGVLACNDDCSFNTDICSTEVCGNGVDDDGDLFIDCTDGDCAADINCDVPAANNNAVGAGFSGALSVALSNNGATAFFTGYNANNQAAIFSVATAGGNAVQLFAGAPLDKPTGIALSPDGTTLFIADLSSGANEAGGVFSMPVAGATPTLIPVVNVVRPSAIAVSNDGATLFIGGADALTGTTGVFSLGFGNTATLLSNLKDPAALAVAGNQVLAVEAVSSNNRSSVVKIPAAGGAATVLATGLTMDYPAGITTLVGDTTVIFAAVDSSLPNFGSGLFQVSINGGAVTPLDVGSDFVSAGAISRARNNNNFVLVDTEAGAGVTGAIFRLQ